MSLSTKLTSIVQQLQTQLKLIDGGSNYNLNINDEYVELGFLPFDQAEAFPSIYIASITTGASSHSDQVTMNVPVEIEVFGYVEKERDTLLEVLKLAQDIEKATYSDKSLNDNVWDMSIGTMEQSAMNSRGICYTVLRCMTEYIDE